MKRGQYEALVVAKHGEWTRIRAGSMTSARARAAEWARGLDFGPFWRTTGLDHLFVRVAIVAWDGERSTDDVRVDRPQGAQ